MKIHVNFTLDVPADSLAALRELASAETNAEARDFVKMDALEYTRGYLEDNGVKVAVTRDDGINPT
jgi:hypothetical protein